MPFYGTGTILFEDDFAYSDGNLGTVGTAKWNAGFWTGQTTLRVVSGKAAGPASNGWRDNYSKTSVSLGSTGIEFIIRNIARAANTDAATFSHVFGAQGASPSSYYILYSNRNGNYYYQAGKLVSGSFNPLITTTQVAVNGDDVCLQILPNGTMSLWRKPSGGSWSQIGSNATDTTRTTGVVALEAFVSAARWDAVEVREIPAASRLKRHNGSIWVPAKLKAGSGWVEKPLKKF